jgi:hypothetical protein
MFEYSVRSLIQVQIKSEKPTSAAGESIIDRLAMPVNFFMTDHEQYGKCGYFSRSPFERALETMLPIVVTT